MPLVRALTTRLKSVPVAYQAARSARTAVNHRLPPRSLPQVVGRVHRNDLMLDSPSPGDATVYNNVGLQIVGALDDALGAVDRSWGDVTSMLDFGCGHGRVLRHVVGRIAPSAATACDLDPEAVDFCAAEFGATPLLSTVAMSDVAFGTYDLIWSGSLVTHLPADAWERWCSLAGSLLRPGGLLVFSTLGPGALDSPATFSPEVQADVASVREAVRRDGFAYRAYGHYRRDSYGVAFHRPDAVRARLEGTGLATVFQRTGAWAGQQDLHAFHRAP